MWAKHPSVPLLLFLQSFLEKTSQVLTNSTVITPTPSTLYQPVSTAKCNLPASVSGKPYAVTPVVYVSRTVSNTLRRTPYTCDTIPAASINKGNFQFACKTLRGKDLGFGGHTISWELPTAASVYIKPFTFTARPPTTTTKYVANKTRATDGLIPMTVVTVTATSSITKTIPSTSTVRVPTSTSTCFATVTVTPVPAARLRRANLRPDPELLLRERATPTRKMAAAGTPKIGRPDATYPPYPVTTIYVRSIYTSTYTNLRVSTFYTGTLVATTTVGYVSVQYGGATITVTATPVATAPR